MTTISSSFPRRGPRAIGFLAAASFVVIGSYLVSGIRPTEPAAPPAATGAPDAGPVDAAPLDGGGAPVGSLAQIDHSIGAWSKNLADNPRDFLASTNLAALYQGRARLSYDLGDYERALRAARSALSIEPSHAPARALEAAILYSLHDFVGAFTAADALVRDDPSQIAAVATRFDASIELGRIDAARVDLRLLREAGGPAVLIREARLASVTGDATAAVERARAARAAALDEDVEDIGFYAYAVGEYARLAGDPDAARSGFAEALELRGDDLAALVGLARIDAFEGRTDAAIDGLRRATAIAPQPESLALLGDLLTKRSSASGDASEASDAYETVRFIERLGDVQATTYDRQLLRFELDHDGVSNDVLARARTSSSERPDWSGYDTVAWALYRLGRFDEAAVSIASARALGADDARLRYHDGAIQLALADAASGNAMVRSALELGPALDPLERAEATRLIGG
ncbi:MAG TPA: tetratricopeptide repeat protein [Candidatus Limnocylindrales bacterium]|nr:tetratricopeptide repeat protein [Candidatus Limnocylindrales bacterium]